MPGMNGLTPRKRFDASASARTTLPIIALTANAAGGSRTLPGRGMNDYMSKPLRRRDVLQATLNALDRARSTMPTASPEPQTAQPLLPHIIDFEQFRAWSAMTVVSSAASSTCSSRQALPVLEDISASLVSRHSTDLRRAAHNRAGPR